MDYELDMLPVRERSAASASLRLYQSANLVPGVRPTTRFKTFVIDDYVALTSGVIVRESDAPPTAKVEVIVGENAAHRQASFDQRKYVMGKLPPTIRWAAGYGSIQERADGTVSSWFALPTSNPELPLAAQGNAKYLRSLNVSLPQYFYRGSYGWTPSDAVSLSSWANLSLALPTSVLDDVAIYAVGVFDKSDATPYEAVTFITASNGRLSLGIDLDDTISLSLDGGVLASCSNPYKPGRLTSMALILYHGVVRALINTVDGEERSLVVDLPQDVRPRAQSMLFGGGSRDVEIVDAGFWVAPVASLLRDQMVELMGYYWTRRLT